MLEKLFDKSFVVIALAMFFVCSISYNIGYFSILGSSLWYFLYIPLSISDLIKTGVFMLFWLIIILVIFKPILINPSFNASFPSANILMFMVVMVFIANFLYSVIFSDSRNNELLLFLEIIFYLFTFLCVVVLIYYFCSNISVHGLVLIFFLTLIPITFFIGIADAKISILSTRSSKKSKIFLTNDKIISANVLRSFDKGILIKEDSYGSNMILWDQIKEINFKKVEGF